MAQELLLRANLGQNGDLYFKSEDGKFVKFIEQVSPVILGKNSLILVSRTYLESTY